MATIITFASAEDGIAVQFKPDRGLNSERCVAVIVRGLNIKKDIASTGFDEPACAMFAFLIDAGTAFSGRLYSQGKNREIGNVSICKVDHGGHLTVVIGGIPVTLVLLDDDMADLRALFAEIGGRP